MSGVKPNLATTLTSEHGGEFGGGGESSEKLTKSAVFFFFFAFFLLNFEASWSQVSPGISLEVQKTSSKLSYVIHAS